MMRYKVLEHTFNSLKNGAKENATFERGIFKTRKEAEERIEELKKERFIIRKEMLNDSYLEQDEKVNYIIEEVKK